MQGHGVCRVCRRERRGFVIRNRGRECRAGGGEKEEEPRRPAKRVQAKKSSVFARSASSRFRKEEEEEGMPSENEHDNANNADADAMDVDMPPLPPQISPPGSPPKRKSKPSVEAAAVGAASAPTPHLVPRLNMIK